FKIRTMSRLAAFETAMTALARRAASGMNGRIASRRRRGWCSGNSHRVVSWIVTIDGHGVSHDATLLVKWQTSVPSRASCHGRTVCIHTVLFRRNPAWWPLVDVGGIGK